MAISSTRKSSRKSINRTPASLKDLVAEMKRVQSRLDSIRQNQTVAPPSKPYAAYPDFKSKIAAEGTPISGILRFQYVNANGEQTRRTVELKFYYPNGWPAYILARCKLRKEDRTFSLRAMKEIYDLNDCKRIEGIESWLLDQR